MSWPAESARGGRARPLGEILRGLLRRKRSREKGKYRALVDAWRGMVGDGVAGRTRIRSFAEGELVIEVDSPVLLHELNSFMKAQLLSGFQATGAGRDVAAVRFCLGSGGEQGDETH